MTNYEAARMLRLISEFQRMIKSIETLVTYLRESNDDSKDDVKELIIKVFEQLANEGQAKFVGFNPFNSMNTEELILPIYLLEDLFIEIQILGNIIYASKA